MGFDPHGPLWPTHRRKAALKAWRRRLTVHSARAVQAQPVPDSKVTQ